jgi:hypothetical protein
MPLSKSKQRYCLLLYKVKLYIVLYDNWERR